MIGNTMADQVDSSTHIRYMFVADANIAQEVAHKAA
jgi:hypothetical protein